MAIYIYKIPIIKVKVRKYIMKKLPYQITIFFVVFSLLLAPVAPAFAQEGTPQSPATAITETETPTEVPVKETPAATETPTPEPVVETPSVTPAITNTGAVTPEVIAPEFVLSLSSNPDFLNRNGNIKLAWEIQGDMSTKTDLMLQISLPEGFTPVMENGEAAFDSNTRLLTVPVTEDRGEIALEASEVNDNSYFMASLQSGEEVLAQVGYFLPSKEEFKIRKAGDAVTALDGKLTVTIPADTFDEEVTLAIGAPSNESMPSYSLSGRPFEITALGETSREDLHSFKNQKQVQFEIQYEDYIDVPEGMEGSLHVWWYNAETAEWEIINSVADPETKTIRAVSDHFSLFDIGLNTWNASRVPSVDAFQVSEFTGAGSYSLPIEVPAGPGGFQPSLSLNYNSQVVDGSSLGTQASWVGMGWSLDVGSIDVDYRGVNNSSFILSVGGVSSHIYKDANGNPHIAEENGWVVQLLGTSPNSYWVVQDTQGNTYTFDYQITAPIGGCSSQQERGWYLTRQTNKYGQFIDYEYDGSEKKTVACGPNQGHIMPTTAVYLTAIKYNGYQVRFERTPISAPRGDYSLADETDQGFHTFMKTYLQNIYVEQDASGNGSFSSVNLIRSYGLEYNTDYTIWPQYTYTAGGKVLTLNKVHEYGTGGTGTLLQTTTFEYADAMHMSRVSNSYGGSVSFDYSPWVSPYTSQVQNYYQEVDPNGQPNSVCYAPWGGWTGSGFGGISCDNNILSVSSGALAITPASRIHPGGAYRVSAQFYAYNTVQARLGIRHTRPSVSGGVYYFGDVYYDSYVNGSNTTTTWPPTLVTLSYTSPILSMDETTAADVLIQANGGSVQVPWFRAETLPTYYRVSSKTVSDAPSGSSPHQYTTSYAYELPSMNPSHTFEAPQYAEFRGHWKVTTTHADGTKTVTKYHQTDDLKGRPSQISEYDAAGKLISQQDLTYSVTSLPVSSTYQLVYKVVEALPERNFTYTTSTTQTAYNTGNMAVGSTTTQYFYNSNYQLSQQKEYEGTDLYRVTNYEYYGNTTKNILGLPARQWVTDAGGTTLAETLYLYDGHTTYNTALTDGILTAQRTLVSGSQYAQTSYGYDTWGNQTSVTTYTGLGSATSAPTTGAATTTTAYDSTYHTYPVTITNALSQAMTITYDYTKGVPLTATDPNGATVKADYDAFGRITAIYRPDPATGSYASSASLTMQYSSSYPFTTTITQENPDYPAHDYVIIKKYDGMGRVTQVNADGIFTDTLYDSATITRQSMPYATGETVYYSTTTVNQSTRTTTSTAPDGTSTVSVTNGLTSTITDANGHNTISINDIWGRTRSVTPPTGPGLSYAYDPLGNLLQVTRGSGGYSSSSSGSTNLSAWWSLDETSGARNDSSTNALNLTDNNTVASQAGMRGNAADLEKNDSEYFSRASSSVLQMGTSDLYVGAWMKAESTMSGYPVLVSKRETSNTNSEYLLRVNATNNTVDFIVWGTSGVYTTASSTATITLGQWYYVEGWTDKANRTVYVNVNNGTPNSATWASNENRDGSGTAALLIGARNNGGIGEYWDGLIDEVTVYKRKLSAAERTWLFNGGSGHTHLEATTPPSSSQTVTTLTYNNAGQKLTMNDVDMGSWSYTYDALGNLKTQTDARNCVLTMGYDSLNRLTSKSSAGSGCGTQVNTSYAYDAGTNGIGRRTSMTNIISNITDSWTYDKRGRMLMATNQGLETEYEYNNADMLITMEYPDDEVVTYGYNPRMLLTTLSGTHNSVTTNYVTSTTYDSAGRVTNRGLGNSLSESFTYYPWDAQISIVGQGGRLQNLTTSSSLQNIAYTYDAVGNVKTLDYSTVTAGVPYAESNSYTYDSLDRLLTWTLGSTTETYGYNTTTGNLETKAGTALAYADTAHKHAATSAGGNTYTYDANGNQITRVIGADTFNLAYDAENRLVEVRKNSTTIATFVYDGDGKRVRATENGTLTKFIGSHYEETGSQITKHYFAGASRIATRKYIVPSSMSLEYVLGDHLGSTSIVTDDLGAKVSEIRYKPWGEVRDSWKASASHSLADYTFTGQYSYMDNPSTSGVTEGFDLMFYNARWYDPALGRFAQADSIVPAGVQGYDRYAYVANNPVKNIDPSGHIDCTAGYDPDCSAGGGATFTKGRCDGAGIKYCVLNKDGARLDKSHFSDGIGDWLIAQDAYNKSNGDLFSFSLNADGYQETMQFEAGLTLEEFRVAFITQYATVYQQNLESSQGPGSSFNTEDISSAVLGAAVASFVPNKYGENGNHFKDFILGKDAYKDFVQDLFSQVADDLGGGFPGKPYHGGQRNHTGNLIVPGVYLVSGGEQVWYGGSPYPRSMNPMSANPAFDLLNNIIYP
jgi:RHS repeat-associated protein